MNKAILILLLIASVTVVQAQKTATLSTQKTLKSASVNLRNYPKLSLNNNQCELQSLRVAQAKDGYQLAFDFANPCAKRQTASLHFEEFEEALMFKNMVMNDRDYKMIHLEVDRNENTSFWIDYSLAPPKKSQLR